MRSCAAVCAEMCIRDRSAPAEAVRVPERFELTPGLVEVADGLAGKWGALLLFADDSVIVAILSATAFFGFILWLFTL